MLEFDNPEIFRSVLETLPIGVHLVDRNRKIIFWNDGAEQITGHRREDVVGHLRRDDLLATDGEMYMDAGLDPADSLTVTLAEGISTTAVASIRHKAGYRVPVILRTVPIRNKQGVIIGAAECFEEDIARGKDFRIH